MINCYAQLFNIHLTIEEVDEMFSRVDLDGNGEIDFAEFAIAAIDERHFLDNENIRVAFERFDKDGGGFFEPDDIRHILSYGSAMTEDDINKILAEIDKNGDGEIDYEEFAQMMLKEIRT